jgi:GcrA cell cycle regulator
MNMTWDDKRVEALKRLVEEGKSFGKIAAELGITRNAAIGKASRLGLKKRDLKTERSLSSISLRLAKKAETPAKRVGETPRPSFIPDPALSAALVDAEPHHCRWIVSNGAEEVRFCGHDKAAGASYCHGHAAMAYKPRVSRQVSTGVSTEPRIRITPDRAGASLGLRVLL